MDRQPFITFLTPTYKRPKGLARCMASVAEQTSVGRIEHLILADYVGRGIGGMYAELAHYRHGINGEYVHILADDDVLAGPTVVERLEMKLAGSRPDVVLLPVDKAGRVIDGSWPPVMGQIDLGNIIVRRDVWQARCHEYGSRYEGDYDFARALQLAGAQAMWFDITLLHGAVSRGEAET